MVIILSTVRYRERQREEAERIKMHRLLMGFPCVVRCLPARFDNATTLSKRIRISVVATTGVASAYGNTLEIRVAGPVTSERGHHLNALIVTTIITDT